MKTDNFLIRVEHQPAIDAYKAVLFLLGRPEEPLPEELFDVLNRTYKSLTESIFNELEEAGYTSSTEALRNTIGSLMLEAIEQIKLLDLDMDSPRRRLLAELFRSISEVYFLLHDAQLEW